MNTTDTIKERNGIVIKPQFDLKYYSVGDAVYVSCERDFCVNGIITKVEPLSMTIQYYNTKCLSFNKLIISIDSVVNGLHKIKRLMIGDE